MNSGKKVLGSLLWKFLERSVYQVINFVVTLILARLLSPDEYGLVAIVISIIAILQVFVDSGMGIALIQKKEVTEIDYSTVFITNLITSIILYGIMFLTAPLISVFYNKDLTDIIRILSLMIIIFAVKNIYQSYIIRNMMFKKAFFASLFGIVVGGGAGIFLAFKHFGVWALVFQQIICEIICTISFMISVKWKPHIGFSFTNFRRIFNFGWKLLLSSLIDTVYNNIRQLLIGKFFSGKDLAYYSKGEQFPSVIVNNINISMNTVLLPVMSQHQDSREEVKNVARKIIRTSSYLIWPMMVGLYVVADELVIMLLTESWMGITPFIRIFCIMYAFQPLQTTNLNVMKSLNRPDLCLKLEIIKKSVAIIIVVFSLAFGVFGVALGSLVYCIFATIINAFPNKYLINYTYFEQIKDICPFILLSLVMGAIVSCVNLLKLSSSVILIIQIIIGICSYVCLSFLLHLDCFYYLISIVKNKLNN